MKGASLKLDALNAAQLYLLILSLFIMIFLFTSPLLLNTDQESIRFLIYILLAVIFNSFITAGLTSPCDRFQARVVWLVPLALILLIIKNIKNYKKVDH